MRTAIFRTSGTVEVSETTARPTMVTATDQITVMGPGMSTATTMGRDTVTGTGIDMGAVLNTVMGILTARTTTTIIRVAYAAYCARSSCRTVTMPPTASMMRWRPVLSASVR